MDRRERRRSMKTGMIGAGKVGTTLGKYISEAKGKEGLLLELTGFYSRTAQSAKAAAEFTKAMEYRTLETIIKENDILFLTVPDGKIKEVWNEIKTFPLEGKIICHCSGLLSSDIFEGIQDTGAFGYALHPLFAISSRWESYRQLSASYFTIEGSEKYISFWEKQFSVLGNPVCVLPKEQKVKYHAAAVFASNFVIALVKTAQELLGSCGFTQEAAKEALLPLFSCNSGAVAGQGIVKALTGPAERADLGTMKAHMDVLTEEDKELYQLLSRKLLLVAKEKNPQRDYKKVEEYLEKERK